MKRAIFIAIFFVLFSQVSFGQWKKIYTFTEDEIPCLYFLNKFGKPNIGFAGISRKSIIKTTDGGNSWYSVKCPPDTNYGTYPSASSITFKNENEGWFVSMYGSTCCYHTTDGGENWEILPDLYAYECVYYNILKQRLFATSFVPVGVNSVLYSDDDGYNWTQVPNTNFLTESIAFSDDLHGCVTPWASHEKFAITSDGGDTWSRANNIDKECWQPVGIPNTSTLFALSERDLTTNTGGPLFRSDDGGLNWNKIYQYPLTKNNALIGTLQRGVDSTIILQTFEDGTEGIMTSEDGGYTWQSICGPLGRQYTRFFAHDSVIFAVDKDSNLWYNSTGIGSNSTPILSKSSIALQAQNCSDIFDTVTFTLFDSCNGRQATLLDVSLNGSTKFSLNSGLVPRSIHPDDTLAIQYKPTSDSTSDTAVIQLRFKLGWKEFDTSITLIGKGYKAKDFITTSFIPDTVYGNTISCANDSEMIHFHVQDTCRDLFATATKGNISGSSAFVLPPQFPKQSTGDDSLVVTFSPLRFGLDTSMLHVTFELDGVNVDTTFVLIGEYRPSKLSLSPSMSDTSLSITSSNCIGASGHIYYSVFDSCLGVKGELVSATETGSTNFLVTADADSATVIYNGAGYDTAKLVLKFRLYEYEYDTVITLYGYPSATKDSLSFLATLTKPSVTWEETTELRITPDKAAANKGLAEIRFDVTLDADVLEPLTNYTTGIAGASIVMLATTPVGKLSRYPFVITGTNMTLDPAVSILNLPMRPYVSDTTMTTINVSTINLNPQDPDYERCTLSATGGGVPFTLELMCGDSTISSFMRTGNLIDIVSIRPNPTTSDITISIESAAVQMASLEIYDMLGKRYYDKVVALPKETTDITVPTSTLPEGQYIIRIGAPTGSASQMFTKKVK